MRDNKKKNSISAVIIAKDAEDKITKCLQSLEWVDEIILVDTGSSDNTNKIAQKYKAKIFPFSKGSYPEWRNYGKDMATGKFLFYLDTDEEVSKDLNNEILEKINSWESSVSCYAIPRKNIVFGKWLKHGGWYPDYVIRLYKKDELIRWENELHEQPVYKGNLKYLTNPIIHHKENTLSEMVVKTNKWSDMEAILMKEAGHPPMNIPRFLSAMFREYWFRFIKNMAFLDGGEGIIMGIYQVYSRFISYAKLWEMQINEKEKVTNKIK